MRKHKRWKVWNNMPQSETYNNLRLPRQNEPRMDLRIHRIMTRHTPPLT